jgi:hypothetical protein
MERDEYGVWPLDRRCDTCNDNYTCQRIVYYTHRVGSGCAALPKGQTPNRGSDLKQRAHHRAHRRTAAMRTVIIAPFMTHRPHTLKPTRLKV